MFAGPVVLLVGNEYYIELFELAGRLHIPDFGKYAFNLQPTATWWRIWQFSRTNLCQVYKHQTVQQKHVRYSVIYHFPGSLICESS